VGDPHARIPDDPRDRIADERGVKARFFDEVYEGTPPWEVGHPQPAVALALERRWFISPVLDLGCGTGSNARLLAAHGHQVLAVDSVPRAIELARQKGGAGDHLRFEIGDALDLSALVPAGWAKTLLDSALFHVFSDEDRVHYARELARVVSRGGTLIILCFSEAEDRPGPRRVSERELVATLTPHFALQSIEQIRYASLAHTGGAHAWLARFTRT
jgi:SAM-dependent methyltransferase